MGVTFERMVIQKSIHHLMLRVISSWALYVSLKENQNNFIRDSNFCKTHCDMSIWCILQLTKEEGNNIRICFVHSSALFISLRRIFNRKSFTDDGSWRNNVGNALLDANFGDERRVQVFLPVFKFCFAYRLVFLSETFL